jgi:hypothetical protein
MIGWKFSLVIRGFKLRRFLNAQDGFRMSIYGVPSQVAKSFSINYLNSIQPITRIKRTRKAPYQAVESLIDLLLFNHSSQKILYWSRSLNNLNTHFVFLEKFLLQNGRQISYSAEICPSQRLLQCGLNLVLIRRKSRTSFYDALN